MIKRQDFSCFSAEVNPLKLKLLDEFLLSGSCLDIGCGNGLYGQTMLKQCVELLQLDVVDRRSSEAKRYPFRMMDVSQLTLPEKSFDNVVAFDIMEHLDDDATFLRDVHRICRGRLILSVPNVEDGQLRMLNLTHIHHTDKTHHREYTGKSLQNVVEKNGFKVLEIRPHYNRGLFLAGRALARGTIFSKIAARTLYWQMLFYERIGLFENCCIGDWFCVAEVL